MPLDPKKPRPPVQVPCPRCDRTTTHNVLKDVSTREEYDEIYWDSYQIIQCAGCKHISFRHEQQNTGDLDYDAETGGPATVIHEKLYPHRRAGRKPLAKAYLLPKKLQVIYAETHSAVCAEQRVLAGVGIRALAEAVCKDKNASGKDLQQKILDLVNQGVLTKAGAEILDGTRLLGNRAAHEVEPATDEQLNAAMDVIEHVVTGVYILPEEAEALAALKKKPKGAPPVSAVVSYPSTVPSAATSGATAQKAGSE